MLSKMFPVALGLLLFLSTSAALGQAGHKHHGAQTGAPSTDTSRGRTGHEGMKMGHVPMDHGMHAHMKALHDHSKMMEGVTNQKKLMEEMKKHMRMMDQMMEMMMRHDMQPTTGDQPTE